MEAAFFNIVGVSGAVIVLLAYYMLERGKIDGHGIQFPILNLSGTLLILISLFWDWNLPSFVIQMCWIAISIYAIANAIRAKKR